MFRNNKKGRKNLRSKRTRRRLIGESLENRKLLAALTVDNGTSLVDAPDVSSITALNNDKGPDGTISLREAIAAANNTAGADTLTLAQGVNLTEVDNVNPNEDAPNGLPVVTSELTIEGGGHAITRGTSGSLRILEVGGGGKLTLNNATISNGHLYTTAHQVSGAGIYVHTGATLNVNNSTITGNYTDGDGAGIYNKGVANISNTLISNNQTHDGNGGGGISNEGGTLTLTSSMVSGNESGSGNGGGLLSQGSSSVTHVRQSTFTGNKGSAGGAIAATQGTHLTVENSTLSGNSADGAGQSHGGGLFVQDYGDSPTVTVNNSTITNNQVLSPFGEVQRGAGIYLNQGTLNLNQSLVSGNLGGSSGVEVFVGAGTIHTNQNVVGHSGHTNAQAVSGFTPGANDITATSDGTDSTALASILNPMLADNGGPTTPAGAILTHALVGGSPAVDTSTTGPNVDQTGFARPQGTLFDAGAMELDQPPHVVSFSRQTPSAELTNADSLVFQVKFNEPVTGVDVSDFVTSGSTATVTSVSGDGDTWDVTISGGDLTDLNGIVGLDLSGTPTIVDSAGLSLPSGEPATDETFTLDNTGPTFSLINSGSSDFFSFPGAITVSASDVSGIDQVEIAVRTPFNVYYDGTAFTQNGMPVFHPTTANGDGTYSLTFDPKAFPMSENFFVEVRASDLAGNVSQGSPPRNFFGFDVDLTVDTLVDESDGDFSAGDRSLREMIELANASVANNVITFANSLSGGEIDLSSELVIQGTLSIDGDLNDDGLPNITIDAQGNSRVLRVTGGTSKIEGVTLTGGSVTGDGGAIQQTGGSLSVSNSRIQNSHVTDGVGGGIAITDSGASLVLSQSEVTDNTALTTNFSGGGISSVGNLTIVNSTIAGNRSDRFGGGIVVFGGTANITQASIAANRSEANNGSGGGISGFGNVNVFNSTITGNSATSSGGGIGAAGSSNFTVTDSIVVGNTASILNDFNPNATAVNSLTSGQASDVFAAIDPIHGGGLLASNSGLVRTVALKESLTNPAIDAALDGRLIESTLNIDLNGDGDTTDVISLDARGANRSIDEPDVANNGSNVTDLGAFEFATTKVNDTGDTDDGNPLNGVTTLREAINFANTTAGADTIRFASSMAGQTISIGSELMIGETLTIDASNLATNVIIDAGQNSRVLNFVGSSGDLNLNRLTLQNGQTSGDGGGVRFASSGTLSLTDSVVSGNRASEMGGGLFSLGGNISLTNSTVDGNSATNMSGQVYGGGIYSSFGLITLTNSTISNNTARDGGGVFNYSGNVLVHNSTISGNSATGDTFGGGGVLARDGSAEFFNSTVTNNHASEDGGGIYVLNGYNISTLTLANTIVASNTATGRGPDIAEASVQAAPLTINHSLIGNTANSGVQSGSGSGNLLNVDPKLSVLGDFLGPTQTHFLQSGSPALDSGDPSFNASSFSPPRTTDQRGTGFDRVFGGRIDIGAFENQGNFPPQLLSFTRQNPTTELTNADSLVFQATFSESVTNVDPSDFLVVGSTATVTAVSGSGDTWNVTISGGDLANLEGVVGLDLSATPTIVDSGGLSLLVGEPVVDETYMLENSVPTFSMATPVPGSTTSLITFPGKVGVNVADPSGVASVEIAVLSPFSQFYDGTSFSSSQPLFFDATLDNGVWSIPISASAFPESQNYFVRVKATDTVGNEANGQTSSHFGIDVDLTVDTATDESDGDYSTGDLSLREAIELTNASLADNVITFDADVFDGELADVIRLTLGQLEITDSVHIDGGSHDVVLSADINGDDTVLPGTFITDIAASETGMVLGDNTNRVIDITAPTGDTVTLTGLTITGGDVTGWAGGIINNASDLIVVNSNIAGNRATENSGGIRSTSGSLTLTNSSVSGNVNTGNSNGGGIQAISGHVTLNNSTVSGNRTNGAWGGGLYAQSGNVSIANSTIVNNTSATNGGGLVTFGTTTFNHSIVVGNDAGTGVAPDFAGQGTMTNFSGSNNLLGTGNTFASGANNQTGASFANAKLGALANNGGTTLTHALLSGSPAINGGDATAVAGQNGIPEFDQRGTGFSRVSTDRLDIGAFELQNEKPEFTSPNSATVVENTQFVIALAATDVDANQTIAFSIAGFGADNSDFEIVGGNQLQFATPPDFENPLDVGGTAGDNVYEVSVRADDGNGGSTLQTIAVTVTPANEPPTFTSPIIASVAENAAGVHPLAATDPESDPIEFSILGVTPAGDLGPGATMAPSTSITSPDGLSTLLFQGSDGNLVVYGPSGVAWASATNGSGANLVTMEPNGNLVIRNGSTVVFQTNSGSDPNSIARLDLGNDSQLRIFRVDGALLWESSFGNNAGVGTTFSVPPLDSSYAVAADNDRFEVVGGELRFKTAPDFENPADVGANNVYDVSVVADDGFGGVTPQTISVTVTDVEEVPPKMTSISRHTPMSETTNADTLDFHVTFDESVQNVDATDFLLSGGSTASITSVAPVQGTGESVYLLTVSGGDLVSFNGTVGIDLAPAQNITDAAGNPLATVEPDIDESYTVDNTGPQVESVVYDSGQNSVIRTLTVTFNGVVSIDPDAFELKDTAGTAVTVIQSVSTVNDKTQAMLTFSGSLVDTSGSLMDGNYQLTILDSKIRDAAGNAMDGDANGSSGGSHVDDFYRLFGDVDGSRNVGLLDFAQLRQSFGKSSTDPGYNAAFDSNANDTVDLLDFAAFRQSFGKTI